MAKKVLNGNENKTGFDAHPENINKEGRPKGSKNRSTILEKWLSAKVDVNDPETKNKIKVPLEDAVILALIKKATSGDVQAIKEIQDTLHGKISDKTEVTGKDGKDLLPAKIKVVFK